MLVSKQKEQVRKIRQYQILRGYSGCLECGSLAVDAYELYEKNKLVCQPCLMGKEGSSSSPISFLEQSKWHKKRWGIDLGEWLTNFQGLPVNAECARKWQTNPEHLPNKCDCLEREAKKSYLLVNDNLARYQEKLKECQCEVSPKVRVDSDDYAWCEKCKASISVASKKRVIKNRNDPRFWGVSSDYKILCLGCLGKRFYGKLEASKRKTFNKYVKRGYE